MTQKVAVVIMNAQMVASYHNYVNIHFSLTCTQNSASIIRVSNVAFAKSASRRVSTSRTRMRRCVKWCHNVRANRMASISIRIDQIVNSFSHVATIGFLITHDVPEIYASINSKVDVCHQIWSHVLVNLHRIQKFLKFI